MANLDFFAVRSDFEKLFSFLFGETDFRVFEDYSELGRPNREFNSFADLCAVFPIGNDEHGNGVTAILQLLSPSVMGPAPEFERIDLDPEKFGVGQFRYRISGFGLVQLHLGGIHNRAITKSHYGHFTERGAARWGEGANVDWKQLSKLSGRVQRHIRRHLAVATVPGRAVLAGAFELQQQGYELKERAPLTWVHPAATPRS